MSDGSDKFHDECGIFGVFGHPDSAAHTALGLHALQHRGQEAAGIVSFDGRHFNSHRGLGLVGDQFSSKDTMERLQGHAAIGHNRYSTTGTTVLRNVQPLFAEFDFGGLAVAHNGNLTNGHSLRRQLVKDGAIFHSTTDTEVINHLVANSRGIPMPQRPTNRHGSEVSRIVDALAQVKGAYSLIALTSEFLLGARDPHGVRPLVLGNLDGAMILASETCALDIIGANFVRDIEPGEVVIIDDEGIQSLSPFAAVQSRFCIFEYVYFSRPDSIVDGVNVYDARRRIGIELAREHPVPGADMVTPVPDSGTPGAIGFAAEAGVPFDIGIIRNHYVGRTFIEPADHIRHLGVKLKHNANKATLAGKSVVLVDDSIVRGTTSVKIVEMVRKAGAAEVHMRIASPPTTHSCYYGVDTPDREGLLAATRDVEQMRQHIGVDSLAFLSMDGMYRAMGLTGRDNTQPQYCDACFSGDYAIPLTDREDGALPSQLSLLAEQ
ncbi:MAG: amidophosphoribosyltransferase [Alphaproteobacteria bacterium]|jgi:amidophosphoribosyltransferase|nr:amidophosphoribosyltransferase [Alphaproteobacteria bacterium]MBT4710203.1 amidophosphoribosyltransferase [Alphaproteobacteria bacterium]MBT5859569.1 amidophosphoribosyltransferase [Alphaproteobacteria bacterium]